MKINNLDNINKKSFFAPSEEYFDELNKKVNAKVFAPKKAKVVYFYQRKRFWLAAASVITFFGLLIFNQPPKEIITINETTFLAESLPESYYNEDDIYSAYADYDQTTSDTIIYLIDVDLPLYYIIEEL